MNTRERTKAKWREYMGFIYAPLLNPRMVFELNQLRKQSEEKLKEEKLKEDIAKAQEELRNSSVCASLYRKFLNCIAGDPFAYGDRLKQPQFAVTKAGRGPGRRLGWRR